jgi:hypothetical protein
VRRKQRQNRKHGDDGICKKFTSSKVKRKGENVEKLTIERLTNRPHRKENK